MRAPELALAEFDGKSYVRALGTSPGVYRMLAKDGATLYVGKAANLKKRVASYFLRPQMEPRIAAMVAQVARVEVTVTRTESEALLLENQLIKAEKPRYNVLLRDDKSYPYIYLSKDEAFPRLAFHRGAKSAPGRYFGPFPSTSAVRDSLELMQKVFQVRQCEDSFFRNRSRPCLQYQIGRCSAPCVGLIAAAEYQETVRHVGLFLEGRQSVVIEDLVASMDRSSAALDFERAAVMRDRIAKLKVLQARSYVLGAKADLDVLACAIRDGVACVSVLFFRDGINLGSRNFFPKAPPGASVEEVLSAFIPQYYLEYRAPAELVVGKTLPDATLIAAVLGEKAGHAVALRDQVRGERARFLELARKNASHALAAELAGQSNQRQRFEALRELLGLEAPPTRLECFDISHTMGEATVAACVVFDANGPLKTQYRRFNIAGISAGDDFAAMRQALDRRFRRIKAGEGVLPDVLFIDGGAGQVAQAVSVLDELGYGGLPIVGVAKGSARRAGDETLVLGASGRELWPGPDSPALHLIQSVRDEAHRFAITGHRGRRSRAREHSRLEDIAGIGARRRSALLKHFGGLAGVVGAGIEELARIPGISRALAERIYAALHAS